MKLLTILSVIFPLMSIICAKGKAKEPNVIAVFSEDDLSGKLPSPEVVAAEIPKNLILQKSKKLRATDITTQDGIQTNTKNKKDNIAKSVYKDDNQVIMTAKNKESKDNNKKKGRSKEIEAVDRKSKSMTDLDENEETAEHYIVVESTPLSSRPFANGVSIPTASIVTVTETAVPTETVQIAKVEATTKIQSDESSTIPPQRIRQFTPRSRMNVKRANSSSCRYYFFNFKIILAITLTSLFIINI